MLCAAITPIRTRVSCCPGKRRVNLLESRPGHKGRGETVISENYSYLHCTGKEKLSQNTSSQNTPFFYH